MIPFRTQVKFFFDHPENIDVANFAAVFQRWIQQNALNELVIDVADYRHVFEGPGIILIGHESDYGIENRDGRLGLLYTRKRQTDSDLPTQLRTAFQRVLTACTLLEGEASFEPRLKFRANEVEIRFADRLQLPNRPESFDLIRDEVEAVLRDVYGGRPVQFAPVAQDSRHLLTIDVRAEGVESVSDLLQHFQVSVEQ
jgi:hypothetical protein